MFKACSGVCPRWLLGLLVRRYTTIRIAAVLPTPAQPGHDGVLKQAAGSGDGAQVVGKEAQIEVGEARALRTWLDVAPQRLQVLIEVFLVPYRAALPRWVLIQPVEAVLQGVFQRIAGLASQGGFAPSVPRGVTSKNAATGLAILQQHGLGNAAETRPRAARPTSEGPQGLFVGQRGGMGAWWDGFARFGQACLPAPASIHPAVGSVIASRRCSMGIGALAPRQ